MICRFHTWLLMITHFFWFSFLASAVAVLNMPHFVPNTDYCLRPPWI